MTSESSELVDNWREYMILLRLFAVLCTVTTISCQGTSAPSWTTQEDCQTLPKGSEKDDCWGHFIVEIFQQDSKKGMEIIQQEVSDPNVQDFLWLEITRKVDPTTTRYCQLIQSQTLKKRCQTLVSRPHLHRETLRERSESKPNQTRKPQ